MFTQMTIGKKLMTGVASLLVCLIGLSYFSVSAVDGLRNDLDEMANKTARKVDIAGTINATTAGLRAEARALVLAAALKNTGDLETARANFGKKAGLIEEKIKEIRPMLVTERGKRATDEL